MDQSALLDILKEIGNIAAGSSGTALSELLKKRISLEVPVVDIIIAYPENLKIKTEGERVVAIFSKILAGLGGEVIFFLREKEAFRLIDLSTKTEERENQIRIFTEMSISLLKEVGNIVICSYLNALGFFLKKILIPSFPVFLSGFVDEVLNVTLSFYQEEDYAYLIETIFAIEEEKIKGSFYFLLSPQTAKLVTENLSS
ncbi:MAG: hypothetical protein B6D55_01325 [Candidatus Omnitrophica bacterium 4484_70.2]|nr:MAG: hypothetical protein B6D55_01325 [Candidatus Omnitrophica bacterium 4484_70.2]